MSGARTSRVGRLGHLIAAASLAGGLGACGQTDFPRIPRPPEPMNVTGVITNEEVTVSPSRIGAGPIVLTVSNQDDDSHTVVLEGRRTREQVGPINPMDTATIQTTVSPQTYDVLAGSKAQVRRSERIQGTRLAVGARRPTGEDELLRP